MGLYDRDYMKEPAPPPEDPKVPVKIWVLVISILLILAFLFRR